MTLAFLGLGSNLGERATMLDLALATLADADQHIVAQSSVYETEPWGLVDQPRFLNSACAIDTDLGPFALLDLCKAIEIDMGREPTVRNGPRVIDIDILLYEDRVVVSPRLTIPHAGLVSRATALLPLADIAAKIVVPTTGRTVRQHLAALGALEGLAPYPPGLS